MKIEMMSINGIGSVWGGLYETVEVNGMGKIKGDIEVKTLDIEGICTAHGAVKASESVVINGMTRFHAPVTVPALSICGSVHFYKRVQTDALTGEGRIYANGEIYASDVEFRIADAGSYIGSLFGDEIELHSHQANTRIFIPGFLNGRAKSGMIRCELIECDVIRADHLLCKTLRCKNAWLGPGCHIGNLECSGELIREGDCVIEQSNQ